MALDAGLTNSLAGGFTGNFVGGCEGDFVGDFVDVFVEHSTFGLSENFFVTLEAGSGLVLADTDVEGLSDDLLKHIDVFLVRTGGGDVMGTSAAGTRSEELAAAGSRFDADAAGEIATLGHGVPSPGLADFRRLTSGLPWRKRLSILFRSRGDMFRNTLKLDQLHKTDGRRGGK